MNFSHRFPNHASHSRVLHLLLRRCSELTMPPFGVQMRDYIVPGDICPGTLGRHGNSEKAVRRLLYEISLAAFVLHRSKVR